jgi:hypothetical protein
MLKKLLFVLAISTVGFAAGFCGDPTNSQSYDMPFLSALKQAKGKDKEYHKMSGIDFVYVITAKKCNRFDDLKRSFSKYNVFPYRFTSFSPKDISHDTMFRTCLRGSRRYKRIEANKLVVRRGKFVLDKRKMRSSRAGHIHRRMSLKALSRALSHISIIKDALDSGYEHIWIMDSGTTLRTDPNTLCTYLERADKEIPDWTSIYTDFSERDAEDYLEPIGHFYGRPDVEFLEPDEYLVREEQNNDPYDYSDDEVDGGSDQDSSGGYQEREDGLEKGKLDDKFTHVGLLKGAHSYILNKKGMKLIMDWYLDHKIFIPYAQEIQIIPGMHPYCTPEPITRNQNKG